MASTLLRLVMILAVAGAVGASGAVFTFYSGFNTPGDTEGWTIHTFGSGPGTGGAAPVQVGTGGYSGGYLQTEDTAGGFLFFTPPSSWSGNLTGGMLGFYLRNENPNNYRESGYTGDPVVWIQSSGGTNLFAFTPDNPTLPGATAQWTANYLDFNSAVWRTGTSASSSIASSAVVNAVLSDVALIGILGDWVPRYGTHPLGCDPSMPFPEAGCVDITGLDEVLLTNIPEPGTLALLGVGLAALLVRRKRSV